MPVWLAVTAVLSLIGLMLWVFSDDGGSILVGLVMFFVFGYLFGVEWKQQDEMRKAPRELCEADGGEWVQELILHTEPDGTVVRVHTQACVFGPEPVEAIDA